MNGTVNILNVGTGDTKLTFDKSNPADCIRAARIVRDMLRRGYALLVEAEVNGKRVYQRAHDFDEDTCEYIIAAGPDSDDAQAFFVERNSKPVPPVDDQREVQSGPEPESPPAALIRKVRKVRVPADKAKVTAVARSAGG